MEAVYGVTVAERPEFNLQLRYRQDVSYSASTLLFLISSMEVKIAPTLWGCCEN